MRCSVIRPKSQPTNITPPGPSAPPSIPSFQNRYQVWAELNLLKNQNREIALKKWQKKGCWLDPHRSGCDGSIEGEIVLHYQTTRIDWIKGECVNAGGKDGIKMVTYYANLCAYVSNIV